MKKLILLFGGIVLLTTSCKKNQLGGNSTIKGTVAHHSKVIPNATVFIKFNTKEFPGADTTKYDAKVRADAVGFYSIKCYKGDYYLYGVGVDYGPATIFPVFGGIPVHVRNKETVAADVAVTE